MDSNQAKNDETSDRVLLSRLLTNAYPVVFAFIRSSIRDFHSCEDIMQEVATIVAQKFDEYDRNRPFEAWAIGIARNSVLMHLRSKTKDRHVFDVATIQTISTACIEAAPELPARRAALETCTQKINGRARKVLEMRYGRGDMPAAIAKSTGMTANAVSILLYRMRKALRDCIEREMGIRRIAPDSPQGGH